MFKEIQTPCKCNEDNLQGDFLSVNIIMNCEL